MLEHIGKWITHKLDELGEASNLFFETAFSFIKGNFNKKEARVQMVAVGVNSVGVSLVTASFVGMVFAIQIASEFVKFGAGNVVGGVLGIAVARELAPTLTAVVFAARVGAAIAAEIGTMTVTEQIDALYAMGSNPVKHLVVPRFIACTLMLPILTVFANIVGFFGGFLVAVYSVGVSPVGFIDSASSLMSVNDVLGGIAKAFVFGAIVAIVGCYRGLKAKGGARGVGDATTSSVVTSLLAIFIVNYFMSVLFFK